MHNWNNEAPLKTHHLEKFQINWKMCKLELKLKTLCIYSKQNLKTWETFFIESRQNLNTAHLLSEKAAYELPHPGLAFKGAFNYSNQVTLIHQLKRIHFTCIVKNNLIKLINLQSALLISNVCVQVFRIFTRLSFSRYRHIHTRHKGTFPNHPNLFQYNSVHYQKWCNQPPYVLCHSIYNLHFHKEVSKAMPKT